MLGMQKSLLRGALLRGPWHCPPPPHPLHDPDCAAPGCESPSRPRCSRQLLKSAMDRCCVQRGEKAERSQASVSDEAREWRRVLTADMATEDVPRAAEPGVGVNNCPGVARRPPRDSAQETARASLILASVKEQELQFERLTRELEAEHHSVATQLERCRLGSEAGSASSVSSAEDPFHWRPSAAAAAGFPVVSSPGGDEDDSEPPAPPPRRDPQSLGALGAFHHNSGSSSSPGGAEEGAAWVSGGGAERRGSPESQEAGTADAGDVPALPSSASSPGSGWRLSQATASPDAVLPAGFSEFPSSAADAASPPLFTFSSSFGSAFHCPPSRRESVAVPAAQSGSPLQALSPQDGSQSLQYPAPPTQAPALQHPESGSSAAQRSASEGGSGAGSSEEEVCAAEAVARGKEASDREEAAPPLAPHGSAFGKGASGGAALSRVLSGPASDSGPCAQQSATPAAAPLPAVIPLARPGKRPPPIPPPRSTPPTAKATAPAQPPSQAPPPPSAPVAPVPATRHALLAQRAAGGGSAEGEALVPAGGRDEEPGPGVPAQRGFRAEHDEDAFRSEAPLPMQQKQQQQQQQLCEHVGPASATHYGQQQDAQEQYRGSEAYTQPHGEMYSETPGLGYSPQGSEMFGDEAGESYPDPGAQRYGQERSHAFGQERFSHEEAVGDSSPYRAPLPEQYTWTLGRRRRTTQGADAYGSHRAGTEAGGGPHAQGAPALYTLTMGRKFTRQAALGGEAAFGHLGSSADSYMDAGAGGDPRGQGAGDAAARRMGHDLYAHAADGAYSLYERREMQFPGQLSGSRVSYSSQLSQGGGAEPPAFLNPAESQGSVGHTTPGSQSPPPLPAHGSSAFYSSTMPFKRSGSGSQRSARSYLTYQRGSFSSAAGGATYTSEEYRHSPSHHLYADIDASQKSPSRQAYVDPEPYRQSPVHQIYADPDSYRQSPSYNADPFPDAYALQASPALNPEPAAASAGYPDAYRYSPGPLSRGEVSAYPQAPTQSLAPTRQPSLDSIHKDPREFAWRDPDLPEVIQMLQHEFPSVQANAAAYLQHVCFGDDLVKAQVRRLGGVPLLVELLDHRVAEVHRGACGALRNLVYGRANDDNKVAARSCMGIPALVRLLRKSADPETRELVTGVLWNLSSCDSLKMPIIQDALAALTHLVLMPQLPGSGPVLHDLTDAGPAGHTLTNTTGCLRNVSSAGEDARKRMRECEGLVEALLGIIRSALGTSGVNSKVVENAVCVLRNLSYRLEAETRQGRQTRGEDERGSSTPGGRGAASKDESSCWGRRRRKKQPDAEWDGAGPMPDSGEQPRGAELLWHPNVAKPYLALLAECSNPDTLEGSAGALQNLAAGSWKWAAYVRAAVRKEKGLPILVELLRVQSERVVCAVATALRNMALDARNKELIGKYALRDLVQRLPNAPGPVPAGEGVGAPIASDPSVAAVCCALHEVISKNLENAKALCDAGGIGRLVGITRGKAGRHSPKVVRAAAQVLNTLWQYRELRGLYKKDGWVQGDFTPPTSTSDWEKHKSSCETLSSSPANRRHSPLSQSVGSVGSPREVFRATDERRPQAEGEKRRSVSTSRCPPPGRPEQPAPQEEPRGGRSQSASRIQTVGPYRAYSIPAPEEAPRHTQSAPGEPADRDRTTLRGPGGSPQRYHVTLGAATAAPNPGAGRVLRPATAPDHTARRDLKANDNYVDFYSAARPPYSVSSYETSQLHNSPDSWV
ncbi:uncharacterized protein LOC116941114 isoform X2 [Petromyzon marinus]|uniref:uncharacterized protein LOC116941114 isoform X2 n=1 Tax=Petromyzon marinus TaxID=7757 RepID=UPI003F72BE38